MARQTKGEAQPQALDVVWGMEAIGKLIGRTTRQTLYLLTIEAIPAKKIGGRWCVSRRTLEQFFSSTGKEAA